MSDSAAEAVAFIPSAPLLVPQVAGGSADLDAELRESCRTVARRLVADNPDVVTIAAPVAAGAGWPADATWGFEGFGVARTPPDPRPRLPWPLAIGDWLLDDVGWTGGRRLIGISPEGIATGTLPEAGVVLVVGDGTARRTEKAPGHLDERAADLDAQIADAIRAGNIASLGAVDVSLAADLLCAGAPVWRWLTGLIGDRSVAEAELLAETAPYGVGYFVGWWRLAQH